MSEVNKCWFLDKQENVSDFEAILLYNDVFKPDIQFS